MRRLFLHVVGRLGERFGWRWARWMFVKVGKYHSWEVPF